MVKNLPDIEGNARGTGLIPGWEDPLEEEVATSSGKFQSDTDEHTHTHTLQWLRRHLRYTNQRQVLCQTV